MTAFPPRSRSVYNLGLDEFFEWFGREPRRMAEEKCYQHWQLARHYGISDAHARELLIQWAAERLIAIRGYDGARLRAWHEWERTDDLFFNTTDSGYIRVKLLATGAALVVDLPALPIGFATP